MEGSELFRKTLKTIGLMLGACVAFVGTITLVALFLVGRAVGSGHPSDTGPELVPASKVPEDAPAKPNPNTNKNKKNDLPAGTTRAI